MNFLTASLERGAQVLQAGVEGAGSVVVDVDHAAGLAGWEGKPVTLGIRAENIEVVAADEGADALRGRVLVVEPLGSHDLLTVRLGREQIKVSTRPDVAIRADDDVGLRLEHDRIIWLDPESGRAIGM